MQDWLRNAWLTAHETTPREIADLVSVIDRDLRDCQTPGLSADWRLNIAYNAALQVAVAALAADGYRTTRESHRHRAIHSLAHTLGTDTNVVVQLEGFRKKRNISDYERAGATSDQEVQEITALARKLRADLLQWLADRHPDVLPDGV